MRDYCSGVLSGYDASLLARAAVITVPSIMGVSLGRRLFDMAPADWFKKVTYGILAATGLTALAF